MTARRLLFRASLPAQAPLHRLEQIVRIDRLPEHAGEVLGIEVARLAGDHDDRNVLSLDMRGQFAL